MSTLWCCPSSIASADQGVAHPPRCPEGWFWRGCRGVWLARTMHVSNITTSQTRSIAHNRIKHEVRCFVLRWRCTVSRTCKFTYWRTDQLGPLKIIQCSSSVQSLDQLGRRGGLDRRFSRESLPAFSARGHCEQFRDVVVHSAFPLPTTAWLTFQAVVACDMPELCKFQSLAATAKGSCGSTRKLLLLRTQSLVLCSKKRDAKKFLDPRCTRSVANDK